MKKTQILYAINLLSILLAVYSCKNGTVNNITLHTVSRGTFADIIMIDGTVEAVNSSKVVCPSMLEGNIAFVVDDGTIVEKGDTVCIMENAEYDNIYQNFINKVEQSKVQYNKGQADLKLNFALLQAQVKTNEAQTEILYLDSAQLSFMTELQRKKKELELKIASLEKQKIEKKLSCLEQINESELKKLELQIQQDEFQAKHVKEILDQMVMTAPIGGLAMRSKSVFNGNKIQEGDHVWEGLPIVEIPDRSKLKVTILTPETFYKRIKENDSVTYIFDAGTGNTGLGKIIKKAPTGVPLSNNSKVRLFEITASVDSFKTQPGIGVTVQCRVFLSHVPDTLVIPQLAVFEEDSIKVVYVKRRQNNFEKRQVITGNTSPSQAVILAGLEEGETVSFTKPRKSKIRSSTLLPDSIVKIKTDTLNEENTSPQNKVDKISAQENEPAIINK